jgi:hypothetical protein
VRKNVKYRIAENANREKRPAAASRGGRSSR